MLAMSASAAKDARQSRDTCFDDKKSDDREIVVLRKTGANLSFQTAQPGSRQMCEAIVHRNVLHDKTLALHLGGTAMKRMKHTV